MKHFEKSSPAKCPICSMSGKFKNTGVAIASGRIHICKECSGYFLFPPVHTEYCNSGWTQMRLQNWNRDTQRGCKFARAICETIRNERGRPIQNVLEIVCGSGFMGKGFNSMNCSYTGIDVDTESINFAKSKGLEAYCASVGKIDNSPIRGRKFDLIISSNCFEHIEDPVKGFNNISSISSGKIIIIVPNPKGLFARMKANKLFSYLIQFYNNANRVIASSIDGYWHNIAYSKETLKYPANGANLKVDKITTIGINDSVFGFVQPNYALPYKLASRLAQLLGMDSQLILFARHPEM